MSTTEEQTVISITGEAVDPTDSGASTNDVASALLSYLSPVIIAIGIVANTLTLIVMNRQSLRNSPVSVYMSALAVTDTLVLIMDVLNNWFLETLKLNLLALSLVFCRFHRFFFNVCYTCSAWLVTSLAIERTIVVFFPLKAKVFCTRKTALVVVSVLIIVSGVLYIPNTWGWVLSEQSNCDMLPQFKFFFSNVAPWLSAALYSYIPAIIMITCSTGIVIQLRRAAIQRRAMLSHSEGTAKISDDVRRVSITVLVVCLTFLLLTVPVTTFYIVLFATGKYLTYTDITALVRAIILVFGLCNHAINFFLYVLTSADFRQELRNLFGFMNIHQSLYTSPSAVAVNMSSPPTVTYI